MNASFERTQSIAVETEYSDSKCTRDFHLLAELSFFFLAIRLIVNSHYLSLYCS